MTRSTFCSRCGKLGKHSWTGPWTHLFLEDDRDHAFVPDTTPGPSEAEQQRRDEERMHEIIMAASEHDLGCGCTDCTVDDREVFYG